MKTGRFLLFVAALALACGAGFADGYIDNVPDANQPPGNPLNIVPWDTSNYCAPFAAVNITEYWDAKGAAGPADDVNGNPNLGVTNTAQYIGWWMRTNDDLIMGGCPYRENGDGVHKAGTMLLDIAPGLAQFALWDANHKFGCTPPNLIPGKKGYSWTVHMNNAGNAWNEITAEIDNTVHPRRPLIVIWNYWNPTNAFYNSADTYTYYDWGPHADNSAGDPNNPSEQWTSLGEIGHATTAVGYKANYDPDYVDENNKGPLPKTDWVIVHDNWSTTATDVAIPMAHQDNHTPVWLANVTVDPNNAPQLGSVTIAAGQNNPLAHQACIGGDDTVAEIKFTAGANGGVLINALTLTANGTGNDFSDIDSISLSAGNTNCSFVGGYPANNGTRTLVIPGDWRFFANAGQSVSIKVSYHLNAAAPNNSTYGFQLTTVYATDTASYLPVTVNNLPFISNQITSRFCFVVGDVYIYDYWWLRRLGMQPDGQYFTLVGSPIRAPRVTAAGSSFGRKAYLQDAEKGGAGLALDYAGSASLQLGQMINDMKVVLTTMNGEKTLYVRDGDAMFFHPGPPAPPLMPTSISNRAVGGCDSFFDVFTHAGRKGVAGGVGLNNIGRLVEVYGFVLPISSTSFYVDDGSRSPVKVVVPSGTPLPTPGSYRGITGVISTQLVGTNLIPVIKTRVITDIWPIP